MARQGYSNLVFGMVLALVAVVTPSAWAAPQQADPHGGAYLGVMVDKVPAEMIASLHLTGGTLITTVDQDGPACQAGLKPGDIVSAFNGKQVSGDEQFASMIHASAAGSTVTLTVIRNGHSQEMKVKLGSWQMHAGVAVPHPPLSPVGTMPPMPPGPPDVEFRSFTPLLARVGILVEPLSPQLSEFFGVSGNRGVLVRTVEKGSPGATAGLRAGDVVVKVNDETIHDMQDWKRALKSKDGKLTLSIVRDKREQTLEMSLPPNTSELKGGDWESFGRKMDEFSAQMQQWKPEVDASTWEMAQMDQGQIQALQKQIQESMKAIEPEMKRQAEEISKQSAQMKVQTEELRKEMEKLTPELQRQAKEMAESMKPSAKDLADVNREIQKAMKDLQPQLQKEMEELRKEWQPQLQKQIEELQKQWQQEMQEWQKSLQESHPRQM